MSTKLQSRLRQTFAQLSAFTYEVHDAEFLTDCHVDWCHVPEIPESKDSFSESLSTSIPSVSFISTTCRTILTWMMLLNLENNLAQSFQPLDFVTARF